MFSTPVIQRLSNRDCTVSTYGATLKACYPTGAGSYSVQKLATDAIGNTQVTFSGINAGTEIRVYLPDGTEVAGIELCAADQVLTWQVYAAGSPNNTVIVRLVHPAYKIKEFSFASSLGAVSLPVQQERDKWYSNPV